jgi:hypothetical protein
MLEPIYPKIFRKQYKLMKKRGMAVDKLLEIMKMIINEQPLPPPTKLENAIIIRFMVIGKVFLNVIFKAIGFLFIYLIPKHVLLLFNAPAVIPICFNTFFTLQKFICSNNYDRYFWEWGMGSREWVANFVSALSASEA